MSEDRKALTFAPARSLTPSVQHVAEVREVTDEDGNTAEPYSWSFTTGKDTTAPRITTVVPADGATRVAPTASVTATFNESVSDVQLTLKNPDGVAVQGTLTGGNDNIEWTFKPTSPLAGSKVYRIEVTGAKDASANVMEPYTWSFTTAVEGLVAAYGMEEGSGTNVADSSGQGNAGTVRQTTWADGKYGKALSFNGSTSWVSVPHAPSLRLTSGMTLSAWVNAPAGARFVVGKELSAQGPSYGLYAANGGRTGPTGRVSTSLTTSSTVSTSTSLAPNSWSHVVLTYEGAALRLFVNGQQVAQTAVSGDLHDNGGPLKIGGNAVGGEFFSGLIDEVRVYNRAQTSAEIQTDMNTPVGPAATSAAVQQRSTDTPTDPGPAITKLTVNDSRSVDGAIVSSTLTPRLTTWLKAGHDDKAKVDVEIAHTSTKSAVDDKRLIWSGQATAKAGESHVTLQVPKDQLHNGEKVKWRARLSTNGTNGAWSGWHDFTVTSTPAPAAVQDPSPIDKPFNYERMTLEQCTQFRKDGGRPYHAFGWAKVTPYSACYSRWKGWGVYDVDVLTGLPKEPIKNGVMMETSLVMNTYLGNEAGDRVQGAGVAGTGLRPRDISVFTSVNNIKVIKNGQAIPPPDDFKMELDIDSIGSDGSTCDWIHGERRLDTLGRWVADGSDDFLFRSIGGNYVTCTIKPTIWLYHPTWTFANNAKVPLWAKPEIERIPSRRDPLVPTVRCDSRSMGPYRPPHVVIYTGACRFLGADRVFQISRSDPFRQEAAQHIWDAFYDSTNTVPQKRNDFGEIVKKDIPGNYDAPRFLPGGVENPSGKALTWVGDKELAPDGKRWRGKNRAATRATCNTHFPNWTDQGKECDEFPFASTKEGMGYGYLDNNNKWVRYQDASARAIKIAQNQTAGRDLWLFYARYRVTHSSKFWVSVK